MTSTNSSTNATSLDVTGVYATAGPIYVAGFAAVLVIMAVTLLRLVRARKTVSRRVKESSNMKVYVAGMGIGAALSHLIMLISWSLHGVAVPGWSVVSDPSTQIAVTTMQSTLYGLSVAFDFHIAGYWMLLMENFVRSTCGIGSSKSGGSGRYGKLKAFKPSMLQWSLFVVPPYLAALTVLVLSIVGPFAGFKWSLVESIRVICGCIVICIGAYVSMNLKVVLMASSNLRMLVQQSSNGTGESNKMSQERQNLITLATRTRNMSYYIAGCCATVAPLAIVIAFTEFLNIPLFFVVVVSSFQGMLLMWLVIVYFSVLRKMTDNTKNSASTSSKSMLTAGGGGSFRNNSELETSQKPMSFQEAIQSMEDDEYSGDEKA